MASAKLPVRAVLCLAMLALVIIGGARTLGGTAGPVALAVPTAASPPTRDTTAPTVIDGVDLRDALAEAGVEVPERASVYAARVVETPDGPTYDQFEAGEGARVDDLWPASSIKVLAAEGALDYLAQLGFTGAASVTMGGETFTVSDVYDGAITDSSNEAYDTLVRIAGVDWLNDVFLTEANGFPTTVIQRSYTGEGVRTSPPMTITEDGRSVTVPERESTGTYDCPDDGNCSNVLEMTDSLRRIVVADAANEKELNLAPTDVAGLQDALLYAQGFIETAVEQALGDDVEIYNKPGYVPGDSCVDVAVVNDVATSKQYLIGVATPEDGTSCPALVELATATLEFLQSTP